MAPRQELFPSILVFESFTMEAPFEMIQSRVFQRTHYPLTVVVSPDREITTRLGLNIQAHYTQFDANLDAFPTYTPRHDPGRLTLVRATARLATSPDDDPDLGWGRFADCGVETLEVGSHQFNLLRPPAVDRLAAKLWRRLAGLRTGHAVA